MGIDISAVTLEKRLVMRNLLPLLLAASTDKVYGRTGYQKLVFLTQKEFKCNKLERLGSKCTIYLHGSFSFELDVIKNLMREGLFIEEMNTTSKGYQVHVYRLSP